MFENPITSILRNFKKEKPSPSVAEKNSSSEKSHVRWAKDRALALVDKGDLHGAISSLISDLSKPSIDKTPNPHQNNPLVSLTASQLLQAPNLDAEKVGKFIESFSE